MRANILILGLDEDLGDSLSAALAGLGHRTTIEPYRSAREAVHAIDRTMADLAFCPSAPETYIELLDLLRDNGRDVPIIIVSRLPEIDNWLDAMDAGACDYCAAPFEPRMCHSLIENALNHRRSPLATAS